MSITIIIVMNIGIIETVVVAIVGCRCAVGRKFVVGERGIAE
jgi:hypothetical protein